MRIAVYSGSFNPLHIGHLAILKKLCTDGSFDGVYLVVSPQNPLKDPSVADNTAERFHNAVEAVERHPELRVRVDDIELNMEAPHYSIRTLDALARREPKNRFTLVMGADNLAIIRHWRDYRRILCEYGVVVYPREGYDLETLRNELLSECPEYKIGLLEAPKVNVSSTAIREGLSLGKDMSDLMM